MTPAAVGTESGQASLRLWPDLIATPERADLSTSAARHFAERFRLDAVRARFDGVAPDPAGWAEIVSSGYLAVGVPEAFGGVGNVPDLVALLEQAGRALLPVPLLANAMALQTRLAFGEPVDPEKGSAEALGDSSRAVLDGGWAQRVILVCPRDRGTVLYELDATVGPAAVHRHVDPSRPLAMFAADGEAIATSDAGIDEMLAPARVALAADLVGVAGGALDRSVRHALERQQFGRPIGSFQAVKHLLANVYVAIERARSLTRAAAIAVASPGDVDIDATVTSLLAKAAAGEAASAATAAFVQVLGAMGQTFEADAHLFFRRAQQTAPFLGSASDCYARAVQLQRGD